MNKAAKPTHIFDFDSTLVTAESLDVLAGIALEGQAGCTQTLSALGELTVLGMTGGIGFDESLNRRLQLFGANRDHVEKVTDMLTDNISPSIWDHRDWFAENLDQIYVISGGFEDYIVPVVSKLGLAADHVFANRFLYDDDGIITGYDSTSLLSQPQGKVKQMEALDLPRPRIIYGDGFTDAEMRKHGEAEVFCAFTETAERPSVIALADVVMSKFQPFEYAT